MPTIIKLKPNPSGFSCWIEFSDNKTIRLPLDWVVSHHLTTGLELSPRLYRRLIRTSIRFRLSEYALRQIALSPKTEWILRQKLRVYCTLHHFKAPHTIERTIKMIKAKGYIDNQHFITYYQAKFPKKSSALIKYELHQKGVPRALIDQLLRIDPESQKKAITMILIKKKVTIDTWRDPREKNRILSAILRKGFSLSEAKSAIDDYLNNRYNKLP